MANIDKICQDFHVRKKKRVNNAMRSNEPPK